MTGMVVWLTGKPSSGKSTMARRIHEQLAGERVPCCVLDGDAVREALRPRPGYTDQERDAFYETLANLAAELAGQGLVVLVPATAHRAYFRQRARERAPAFIEVFVQASGAEVRERDAKGLYRAVAEGQAQGVPGADMDYEVPEQPDVIADGGHDDAAIAAVLQRVRPGGN